MVKSSKQIEIFRGIHLLSVFSLIIPYLVYAVSYKINLKVAQTSLLIGFILAFLLFIIYRIGSWYAIFNKMKEAKK